eukprot:65850_1
MLPSLQDYINVYDLVQKNIIKTVSFPGNATWGSCVTSNNQYIFIIGGWVSGSGSVKEFHIYNRYTTTWSTGTSLNNGRSRHSCNVVETTVYIIGGGGFNSIEYIKNGTWIQMNDTLSTSERYSHISVVF